MYYIIYTHITNIYFQKNCESCDQVLLFLCTGKKKGENGADRNIEMGDRESDKGGRRERERGRELRERERIERETYDNRLQHSFLTYFHLVSNFIDFCSDNSQRDLI